MQQDMVDGLLEQWRRVRPDLDPEPMAVVFRIKRLARLFERATSRSFSAHGLEPIEFSALATLRRLGAPYRMSMGQLGHALLLASGTTTNRVDRLERAGWIRRLDDPADRRGVLVELTTAGLRKVDAAVEQHLRVEAALIAALGDSQRAQLVGLLRKLVVALDEPLEPIRAELAEPDAQKAGGSRVARRARRARSPAAADTPATRGR